MQLAWFRILGLSQVKVHTSGVGLGVGSGVDTAVVVVGVIMLAVAGSVSPTAIIPVGVDVIFAVVGVVALGVIVPLGRICSTVVQCVEKKLFPQLYVTQSYILLSDYLGNFMWMIRKFIHRCQQVLYKLV